MAPFTRSFRIFTFLLLTLAISTLLACRTPREFEFRQIEEMKIEKAGFTITVMSASLYRSSISYGSFQPVLAFTGLYNPIPHTDD
jgi:hypothetical protein